MSADQVEVGDRQPGLCDHGFNVWVPLAPGQTVLSRTFGGNLMAVRVHVVGAYDATEADFRAALDLIGGDGNGSQRFRVGCSGRWMWANASVWHVGGSEIDDALSSLSVPALRVTSSDGVLWMLTLTGPGRDRFRGVHHFTMVGSKPAAFENPDDEAVDDDFPEDELEEVAGVNKYDPETQFLWDAEEEARLKKEYAEEEAATVEGLDDYTDYGVILPEAVTAEMKLHPEQAEYIAFVAHGPQIVDAVEDFGFPCDRLEMLRLLTTGPLTAVECDADVGNMPRFLRTLGISGVFDDNAESDQEAQYAAAAAEKEEPVDWQEYPPGKLFGQFEKLHRDCPLSEISGGPVQLTHVALLHLLSHLCVENPSTFVQLAFPHQATVPNRVWEDMDNLEVRHDRATWQFCFETDHWWYGIDERSELETNDLAEALGKPPDDTRVELTFAVTGLAEACHRYSGTWRRGLLLLEQAYPPVTATVLNDALQLVDQVCDSRPIVLMSEEEEQTVRQTCQRSQGELPRIRNGKVKPECGGRECVVQVLLFERFDQEGPWDLAGARKIVEASWELYEQVVDGNMDDEDDTDDDDDDEVSPFARMMEQMNAAAVVPHSEEVLYEGRTGQFLRASMSDLKHVSAEYLGDLDATMTSLGFQWVVDSVGDVDQRQELTRCYSGHKHAIALHGQRNADNQFGWAAVPDGAVSVDFSQGTKEFHSHFEDGTALVTTSVDAVTSRPAAGIFVRCYEDISLTRLWEKHLDGLRRMQEHRDTVPVDHTRFMDPADFLAIMDGLFCRFMGLT